MGKRHRWGKFQTAVMEAAAKGLAAEEIADDLRRKDRQWSRLSRHALVLSVKKMLTDEEKGNGRSKKQRKQRDSDSSASSEASDDGESQRLIPPFDMINDSLRDSYAKSRVNVELEAASNSKAGSDVGTSVRASPSESGVVQSPKGPRFEDLGGLKGVLDELIDDVKFIKLQLYLGVTPIRGILLHGPPGCGKTKLAHAIANEIGVPFYKISAPALVSGVSGASEENIRELFSKASRTSPSIVFIDEIDVIASERENTQKGMEGRILAQLLTCMDEWYSPASDGSESKPGHILVIGATNRPDALDSALRRSGRFDREITLGVPDEKAREEILSVLSRNLRFKGSFDHARVARLTPGFVGADFATLVNEANRIAAKRFHRSRCLELSMDTGDSEYSLKQLFSPEEKEKFFVTMSDFEEALKKVRPGLTRKGFSTVPNITWEDIGGLQHLRQELEDRIVGHLKFPEVYAEFGLNIGTGFLFYGPPGCGKTTIGMAVANETGANFIYIKGPELLNKYVGESERGVRELFSRARMSSPCILFFDEIDALTTARGREGAWVVGGVMSQLLAELDGTKQRSDIVVIGATNRPDMMDPAVLREGRFGKLLYVPLPSLDERVSILKAVTRKKHLDESVDLKAIAERCENHSGSDLKALVEEAAMAGCKEKLMSRGSCPNSSSGGVIKMTHFEQALAKSSPSVSEQQRRFYEELSKKLQRGM